MLTDVIFVSLMIQIRSHQTEMIVVLQASPSFYLYIKWIFFAMCVGPKIILQDLFLLFVSAWDENNGAIKMCLGKVA